jgi:hypothetical protein
LQFWRIHGRDLFYPVVPTILKNHGLFLSDFENLRGIQTGP